MWRNVPRKDSADVDTIEEITYSFRRGIASFYFNNFFHFLAFVSHFFFFTLQLDIFTKLVLYNTTTSKHTAKVREMATAWNSWSSLRVMARRVPQRQHGSMAREFFNSQWESTSTLTVPSLYAGRGFLHGALNVVQVNAQVAVAQAASSRVTSGCLHSSVG